MGQRHQIFLKVLNPVKNERLFTMDGERTKARKVFGSGKYTVIALHHQWLYGRSAPVNLLNMMLYTNQETMEHYSNPFGKDFYSNGESTLKEYADSVMGMLQVQPNLLHPRGIGKERMHFLNIDDPIMRKDFTMGDNNDGITIIDTIEKKYCMMNISDYGDDDNEINQSASDLQVLLPVSAKEYMQAYYPETVKGFSEYYKEDNTTQELADMAKENIHENNKIVDEVLRSLTGGVLTIPELKKIFPKYYKEKAKKA